MRNGVSPKLKNLYELINCSDCQLKAAYHLLLQHNNQMAFWPGSNMLLYLYQ